MGYYPKVIRPFYSSKNVFAVEVTWFLTLLMGITKEGAPAA